MVADRISKETTRGRTSRAIYAGILERKPCEICGAIPAEAHHEDYSDHLKIRFLCRPHHREIHRGLPREKAYEPHESDLLPVSEVACQLGVHSETVSRRIKRGEIKAYSLSKKTIRIPRSELNRLLNGTKV
jgi:excisionase family DNA binding protein